MKQVDFDGKYEYSKLISVSCFTEPQYILKNPIREGDKIEIQNLKENDKITVYNMVGQFVDIDDLKSGMYIVYVNDIFLGKLIVN